MVSAVLGFASTIPVRNKQGAKATQCPATATERERGSTKAQQCVCAVAGTLPSIGNKERRRRSAKGQQDVVQA